MDTAAERAGEGRKAKVRDVVYLLLPDGLMIFLGLLMAPIVIIPLLTQSLPQPVAGFFNMADTTIIAIFVLEYVLKLVLAEDPASHFLDRWHLLDLAIITLPFLEAVPVAGRARGIPGASAMPRRGSVSRSGPQVTQRLFMVFPTDGISWRHRSSVTVSKPARGAISP